MSNYVIKIVKDKEQLSSRCDEINVQENLKHVTKVVNDLKDTLRANKDLMALSAPQIGVNERVFCVRFADGEIKSFINPMITKIQGKCLMIEKALNSDQEYLMQRPERILVGYQLPTGKAETDLSLKNPLSAIFEQMIDIIDGTLFFKQEFLGLPIDNAYYKAPQEQKDELHKWYLETYIPSKVEELQKIADNDKDIKETCDAINFMSSVISGETELVPEIGGKLDFEQSSLKIKESNDKMQKTYEDALKKKFGIN